MNVDRKQITWAQFIVCNPDKRTSFENMCRLLFMKTLCNNDVLDHSNPNNPGIEIEPVVGKDGKRISFQAKFFDALDSSAYTQIKDSAETTKKYYNGKVDIVYLYCNHDITTSQKTYKDTVSLLQECYIELKLITNQTLLNQIIECPTIASYYFVAHDLDEKWFGQNVQAGLNNLGARFNRDFNVNTIANAYIDFFLHNADGISLINQRKIDSIKEIEKVGWRQFEYRAFVSRIIAFIRDIPDITATSISDCLQWNDCIKAEFSQEFSDIKQKYDDLEEFIFEGDRCPQEQKQNKTNELHHLGELLAFSDLLSFEESERYAILNNMLVINGAAGTGKSQLFAVSAKKMIDQGGHAVLLLGQSFINNSYLEDQLKSNLHISFGMEEFINTLECVGEKTGQQIPIFIDAINESPYRDIWKNGLSWLYGLVQQTKYVRLAVSVRSGYEPFVFDENIKSLLEDHTISCIEHQGFADDSINSIRAFLNHYGVPFYPSYYLDSEFSNPLFLYLFCQLYKPEDAQRGFRIFELFDRLLIKANCEILKKNGIEADSYILGELINQIAEKQIEVRKKHLSKSELSSLSFWSDNGIINKVDSLSILTKNGVIHSFASGGIEYYRLGYELLENYCCAKYIIEKHDSKDDLREYITDDLLKIEDGIIQRSYNKGVFIALCGLYAEKFHEECIDIIDALNDDFLIGFIVRPYLESYSLRKSSAIKSDFFLSFCNQHHIHPNDFFSILFENSVKKNHSLNAEFLHQVLMSYSLTRRDHIWTIAINSLDYDHRVRQIIRYLVEGNSFVNIDSDSVWLLLILLTWLLTATDRILRDNASKALVELLKNHFELCLSLLKKFDGVNDPYVSQRLYAVIFGACVKRKAEKREEYKLLAEYVYTSFFCQGDVYPDILLRDYARLIIERFTYEFPGDLAIDSAAILPPYHSEPIPTIEDEGSSSNAEESDETEESMQPDTHRSPLQWGDFGRYIFQSTLDDFEDINIDNIYQYALHYIYDELGYQKELFSAYDRQRRPIGYNYSQTKKVERIGKKYQWIAFYHILARVSDNHKKKKLYDADTDTFLGPWQIGVRDFDPTVNPFLPISPEIPTLLFADYHHDFIPFNSTEDVVKSWISEKGSFLSDLPSTLIMEDSDGVEWIRLYSYDNAEIHSGDTPEILGARRQILEAFTEGYVIKKDDFEKITTALQSVNLHREKFPESGDSLDAYIREYPWALASNPIDKDGWQDFEAYTGRMIEVPAYSSDVEIDPIEGLVSLHIEADHTELVKEKAYVAELLPASHRITWSSEYDASIEDAVNYNVPCRSLMSYFNLKQGTNDGCYYMNDELAACDIKGIGDSKALILRKEYLDRFLEETSCRLIWISHGMKDFLYTSSDQKFQYYGGVLCYDGQTAQGEIDLIQED